MHHAGYVLAGGNSSRMGRDKALMRYGATTLLQHIANTVAEAAGAASVIGDPDRYGSYGYPVHPDRIPGCGPAGGIFTALSITHSPWNLIVGCDMPLLNAGTLERLLEIADLSQGKCVVPLGAGCQPQPLCAVYHVECLAAFEQALQDKRLKMTDLVKEMDAVLVSGLDPAIFLNVNTPEDWGGVDQSNS